MPTGSGTGTRAAPPYAVTAGELIAEIRVALDDAAEEAWTDAELLGFLGEAVREYSVHLPRLTEAALAVVGGERRYALPWDAIGVIGVEYPSDEEPPS